jgi:hypothetical protein
MSGYSRCRWEDEVEAKTLCVPACNSLHAISLKRLQPLALDQRREVATIPIEITDMLVGPSVKERSRRSRNFAREPLIGRGVTPFCDPHRCSLYSIRANIGQRMR